jgi:hypothetical protein
VRIISKILQIWRHGEYFFPHFVDSANFVAKKPQPLCEFEEGEKEGVKRVKARVYLK